MMEEKIRALYEEVFLGSNAQAAERYLAPGYRQHNPGVADGRDGFIKTFADAFAAGKKMKLTIVKIVIGEGCAAVLLSRGDNPSPYGDLVDLYRFDEAGMLYEHWDVFGGR